MSIEGKISNQATAQFKHKCEKCKRVLPEPLLKVVPFPSSLTGEEKHYFLYSYLHSYAYIYETRRGFSVLYCSDACRKAHNHRFSKQVKKVFHRGPTIDVKSLKIGEELFTKYKTTFKDDTDSEVSFVVGSPFFVSKIEKDSITLSNTFYYFVVENKYINKYLSKDKP